MSGSFDDLLAEVKNREPAEMDMSHLYAALGKSGSQPQPSQPESASAGQSREQLSEQASEPPESPEISEPAELTPAESAEPVVEHEFDSGSVPELDGEPAHAADQRSERDNELISAERKSDERDAIQAADGESKRGTGRSTAGTTSLPRAAFHISSQKSQPQVRNLPARFIDELRRQITAAAVRHFNVDETEAVQFAHRLSQPALVTAFLLARLDVDFDTDESTEMAAELFRAQDPLLGSLVARMAELESREGQRSADFAKLDLQVRELTDTAAVIEQSVAYLIADRSSNFLRGGTPLEDAPLAHSNVLAVRDRARTETRKQLQIERDRRGRPLR